MDGSNTMHHFQFVVVRSGGRRWKNEESGLLILIISYPTSHAFLRDYAREIVTPTEKQQAIHQQHWFVQGGIDLDLLVVNTLKNYF